MLILKRQPFANWKKKLLTLEKLTLLYDFYSAIGFCNERLKLYLASDLTKVNNPRPQDEDETLELLEVSLEEAKQLIQSGDCTPKLNKISQENAPFAVWI